jgi:hypothetical protein
MRRWVIRRDVRHLFKPHVVSIMHNAALFLAANLDVAGTHDRKQQNDGQNKSLHIQHVTLNWDTNPRLGLINAVHVNMGFKFSSFRVRDAGVGPTPLAPPCRSLRFYDAGSE